MKIGSCALQWGMGIDARTRYTWDGKVWNVTMEQVLDGISKLGYKGFECAEGDLVPFFAKSSEFRRLAGSRDLQFVSVWNTILPKESASGSSRFSPEEATVNPSLPMADPGQFRRICIDEITEEKVRADLLGKVEFAAKVREMGGDCLIYGGPFILGKDVREGDYRVVAEMLNELGEQLRGMDLRLAYHPHISTLVQDSKDVDKLYDYADERVVGLTFDSAHLSVAGEDLPRFIRRYAKRIAHVHLKDSLRGRFVELGSGELDIAGAIRALEATDYGFWAMVELDIPNGSPYESAVVSKKYLDSIVA